MTSLNRDIHPGDSWPYITHKRNDKLKNKAKQSVPNFWSKFKRPYFSKQIIFKIWGEKNYLKNLIILLSSYCWDKSWKVKSLFRTIQIIFRSLQFWIFLTPGDILVLVRRYNPAEELDNPQCLVPLLFSWHLFCMTLQFLWQFSLENISVLWHLPFKDISVLWNFSLGKI